MKKITSIFIIIAVLITVLIPLSPAALAAEPEDPEIRAAAAVLYEKTSGQFLYDKNAAEPFRPGSLASVMTILLAVEAIGRGELRLHQSVTVTQEALSDLGSEEERNYDPGEHVRFSDLLYAAYIGSESEACYIIADAVGGSVKEFVALMNARAKALGCTGTLFADPAGAGSAEQYTTARDQVIIFSAAVENSLFLSIAQTTSHRTAATERSPERVIVNTNLAMRPESEYYAPGSYAGKPDKTPDNGHSFVSAATVGNMQLFAAVIGAESVQRRGQAALIESYTESARLYMWAASSFSWRNVTMEHRVVATMPVDYGQERDKVDLSPAETIRLLLPNAVTDADIKFSIALHGRNGGGSLTAPVTRGEILGAMTVRIPGGQEIKVPLMAEQSISMDRKSFFRAELVKAITNKWVILGFVLLVVIMGVYAYIVVMHKRTQQENEVRRREALRRWHEERQSGGDTTRLELIAAAARRAPEQDASAEDAPAVPRSVQNGMPKPDAPQSTQNGGIPKPSALPEAPQKPQNGAPKPDALRNGENGGAPDLSAPHAAPGSAQNGAPKPDTPRSAQNGAPKPDTPRSAHNGAPKLDTPRSAQNGGTPKLSAPPDAPQKPQNGAPKLPAPDEDDALINADALTDEDIIRLASLSKDDLLAGIEDLIETDSMEF